MRTHAGMPFRLFILLLLLLFLSLVLADVDPLSDYYGCIPERCADPVNDSFFSYHACCLDECCHKYRFWVIPVGIAGIGFLAGAFFALCFQCRE